jgi:hypothetical protein
LTSLRAATTSTRYKMRCGTRAGVILCRCMRPSCCLRCLLAQEFLVEDAAGTGRITDKATGRCLTIKVCTAAWPSTSCTNACTHGDGDVVVLEDCDLADTCHWHPVLSRMTVHDCRVLPQ